MKQKDIFVIGLVVIIAVIISYFASNAIIGKPDSSKRQKSVITMEKINPKFDLPDSNYFNDKSINPKVNVKIDQSKNPDIFNNAQ